MKSIYMNFATQADAAITDVTSRSKILAMALAVAVSNQVAVPTSEVQSPTDHYNSNILPRVRVLVSEFNENVVFDCAYALEYTRTLWLLRYNASHPVSRPIYSTEGTFFESIMGVGTFISNDLNCFCAQFKNEILTLSTLAAVILAESGEQNA